MDTACEARRADAMMHRLAMRAVNLRISEFEQIIGPPLAVKRRAANRGNRGVSEEGLRNDPAALSRPVALSSKIKACMSEPFKNSGPLFCLKRNSIRPFKTGGNKTDIVLGQTSFWVYQYFLSLFSG